MTEPDDDADATQPVPWDIAADMDMINKRIKDLGDEAKRKDK